MSGSTSCVYLYVLGPEDGPYKVGISSSPQARLVELQTGCPFPLTVRALSEGMTRKEARALEMSVHEHLSPYQTQGEWFRASLDEILEAMKAPTALADGLYADALRVMERAPSLEDTVVNRLALKGAQDILRQRGYAEAYRERNRDHLRRKNTKRMKALREAAKAKAAEADPFAE